MMQVNALRRERNDCHDRGATEDGAAQGMRLSAVRGRVLLPYELDADLIALWKQFCHFDPIFRSPFYHPRFTLGVAACRTDSRVAVLERGSQIIGFLPFHLVRNRVGKPIGGHLNDYHGPILAPGVAIGPAALLGAAGLDAYDFNHMPGLLEDLIRGAPDAGMSPQMDLTGGYDAYAARKGSSWTKAQREIGRRNRKAESELGPMQFRFHDPSGEIYRQLVALKNRQYARLGVRRTMDEGWAGQVLERLRTIDEPDFAAVVSTLHAGDRLIAAHFGLRTAELLHWWFPSYDLSLAKLGPGKNLVNQCAISAGEHGIRMIDFGKGDEDFKLHFADRHVALHQGSLVAPGSLAGAIRKGADAVLAATRRIPLGRYQAHPDKVIARMISGVTLPG